jgi:hypothetical protein
MKKSFFLLLFAAFIGFAANAQTQKTTTTTASTSKPATTTTAAKPATTTQSPKPAELNIPAAVSSAFKAKYASVTSPSWKMKGGNYQASFRMNNEEMKAEFDNTGKWLQTENKIATTSLPATVQSEIKKDFVDYKTEDAHKLTSATTGTGYTAKVVKGTDKYEVVFGADGKVISKTKV